MIKINIWCKKIASGLFFESGYSIPRSLTDDHLVWIWCSLSFLLPATLKIVANSLSMFYRCLRFRLLIGIRFSLWLLLLGENGAWFENAKQVHYCYSFLFFLKFAWKLTLSRVHSRCTPYYLKKCLYFSWLYDGYLATWFGEVNTMLIVNPPPTTTNRNLCKGFWA